MVSVVRRITDNDRSITIGRTVHVPRYGKINFDFASKSSSQIKRL